ncbi:hypothetical protein MUP59_02425 [Candidatus Bathyarchaeota archaeon]|nr:hypothetical protein [Candidatus Bathyarchaeota archaeon]
MTPPWASESYVPDREYYTSTYASISQIARQRGVSPIPYQEQCNDAGGTARDEGQSHGAHAWGIEISTEFFPRYSKIKASLMPKLIPVLMATT